MAKKGSRRSDGTWQLGPADRDQPAGRVLPLVLEGYLLEFRSHEAGVRADEDPEELHDYRVALRRTRSLLSAGRRVFPAEELELLEALATWMARLTSPVRDLDVLLDDLDALGERVGPELADGLAPLSAALGARRAAEHAELIGAIDGERYPVLLRRWQVMSTVYRVGGGDPGPDASRPSGDVADELVLRSYRRMRKRGKAAMATDDRTAWHDLRKAVKRFRYLVAAFAPMYEPDAFTKVGKRLKGLQDTLGRLQDHHVQAGWVEDVGAAAGGRAALAAGVVADALHRDAEEAHVRCRDEWRDFDRPKLRHQLTDLLSSEI